jgi:hypothetical protein
MKGKVFSIFAILIIAFSIFKIDYTDKFWKIDFVIKADVNGYYAYLPAYFIEHDVTLKFLSNPKTQNYGKYYNVPGPNNSLLIKYTCGVSILHAPFFLAAHLLAPAFNQPQDGYSDIYEIALLLSSSVYLILGLFFLRAVLLIYFDDWIAAISLLTVFFATNLLDYATNEAGMTHAYTFGLFSFFIWLTIKWHKKPGVLLSILLGLTGGFAVLLRPTNLLIWVLFLLYDVSNLKAFKTKIQMLFSHYFHLVIMVVILFIAIAPQLIYWKTVTSQWVYYSYNNEGFFFTHPKLIDGLFSYRNGWLVYSPIMIFALAGCLILKKYVKEFALAIPVLMIVSTYVILSWWCWWYVGFGNRAFVEYGAILMLPFASLLTYLSKKSKLVSVLFILIIASASYLNVFQQWQYKTGLMHWDSMNKRAYWALFLKDYKPPGFDYLLTAPDYEKAMREREVLK